MKYKILIICVLLTNALFADFKEHEKLPHISLPDQFENHLKVLDTDKLLVVAFEKNIASAINNYLKTKSSNYLEEQHTKYISDISAMPSLITSMFAIPKMKKYPFSIMLINNNFGEQFSKKEGKITIYHITNHKISKIEFISPDKLQTVFK